MKTIRRNAHRKIAAIALAIVKVRMYDQVRGSTVDLTEGTTAASAVMSAFAYLNDADYGAKLYDNEDGSYTIHVHSNLYFYLYTQAHLDADKVKQAKRDAARPAIATPAREQRNAATIARTTSIHDLGKPAVLSFAPGTKVLWRDDRSECGTVTQDGRPAVTVETVHGSQEILSGRLIAAKPAVTATRTRMAIGDMISQACTALGIKLGHSWNKGTATFLVQGRDYTAGELADLVLEGGFAGNYGGNEVRVNWDSPLAAPKNTAQRMGRAVAAVRDIQERVSADTGRQLDEVTQALLDLLHGWAIEDAPKPRVDFPSGAAEPDFDVTAVMCVRTGDVWLRRERGWVSGDRWSTWYSLNLIDPMSEGFNIHRKES